MKKSIALILVLAVCLTFGTVTAFATEPMKTATTPEATVTESIEVTPRIVHQYTKTVTNFYSDYAAAPSSMPYTEYNMGAWFSGTLYLQSIIRSGTGWSATYSGTLVGTI